jgi:hypothetical protein
MAWKGTTTNGQNQVAKLKRHDANLKPKGNYSCKAEATKAKLQ